MNALLTPWRYPLAQMMTHLCRTGLEPLHELAPASTRPASHPTALPFLSPPTATNPNQSLNLGYENIFFSSSAQKAFLEKANILLVFSYSAQMSPCVKSYTFSQQFFLFGVSFSDRTGSSCKLGLYLSLLCVIVPSKSVVWNCLLIHDCWMMDTKGEGFLYVELLPTICLATRLLAPFG